MIFTTIVATMSIMGLLTAGANTAGTIHDKAIIDESLSLMRDQATQMQNLADDESDPESKRAKLKIAENLSLTETTLSGLNESTYNRKLSTEVFGLAKGLLTPKIDGIENFTGISVSTQDAYIAAKAANGDIIDSDVATWKNLANTTSDSEIAILIAKARSLTKELDEVSSEVESKYVEYKELELGEKLGLTDQKTVEKKLVEVIEGDENLKSLLLGDEYTPVEIENDGPNGGIFDDEPSSNGPNGDVIIEQDLENKVTEIAGNMQVVWGNANGSVHVDSADWDAEWELETEGSVVLSFNDPFEDGVEGSFRVEIYSNEDLIKETTVVNSQSISLGTGKYTIVVLPINGRASWNCDW